MPGDRPADAQHKLSERRESLAFEHVLENRLKLRNDEDHEDGQNCHRDENHRARIKHGSLHLAPDFLGFFHEFGQTVQDHFQHAAQFAGFDHVHEQPVEDFGVLRQSLGKSASAFDGQRQVVDDRFERGIPLLTFQDAQTAKQRQPGIDQRCQLAGERSQHLWLHAAAQPGDFYIDIDPAALLFPFGIRGPYGLGFLVRLVLGLVGFDHFRGEVTHFFEPADGLVLAAHVQGAFGLLPSRIHGNVVEFWHNRPLDQVYFRTSSIVVSPSKILRMPSSRNVTIPSSTAFWRMTTVGARSLISARTGSLMTRSSKIPFRPL